MKRLVRGVCMCERARVEESPAESCTRRGARVTDKRTQHNISSPSPSRNFGRVPENWSRPPFPPARRPTRWKFATFKRAPRPGGLGSPSVDLCTAHSRIAAAPGVCHYPPHPPEQNERLRLLLYGYCTAPIPKLLHNIITYHTVLRCS